VFSNRIQNSLEPNEFSRALRQAQSTGKPLIDLTESNPTRAGLQYPDDLLTLLGDVRGLTYAPRPLGLDVARDAVARDYARRQLAVPSNRIVLMASTSEAYSVLFKLLCNPGDEVLVPRPSYPLFEHLTRLDSVTPVAYDLEYHDRWNVDVDSMRRAFSPRTRAALLVSPNNPTGSFVKPSELSDIVRLCTQHSAAIIADEVFADYELDGETANRGQLFAHDDVLGFSLGGLSKSVGLPQAKLAWTALSGPDALVAESLARLEIVCDMYLSVSTPIQLAAAGLLERGDSIRRQIQTRVRTNYQTLLDRAATTRSCRVLHAEGGWYAVIQVPSLSTEEDLVVSLVTDHAVVAHPGYFFDFPRESYLIVSLLTPTAMFGDGIGRIFGHFDCSLKQS
jgi:aspartate/methionine/tyrosine aminotransferase